MRYDKWLSMALVVVGWLSLGAPLLDAQVITYSVPTVTYYAPAAVAPTLSAAPVTTYYAPAAPVTAYYAPSAPVTAYYAPATSIAPVTTYYAPAASSAAVTAYYAPAATTTTTVLSPVVPAATVVRTPYWVYDPSRILPSRRWRLVY